MIPIRSSIHSVTPPYVTIGLIFANAAVFFLEASLPPEILNSLIHTFGVIPLRQKWALGNDILALDMWLLPIFTSLFLHGSWLHLLGNMLYLWVFGDAVEGLLGQKRFLLFYLLAGAAASQAQFLMNAGSNVPMVGASGAIAGVLGAYLVLYPKSRIIVVFPVFIYPLLFAVPAFLFLFVWFLQNLFAGSLASLSTYAGDAAGGVAWWAHAGGFAAGMLLLRLLRKKRHDPHDFHNGPLLMDESFFYREF